MLTYGQIVRKVWGHSKPRLRRCFGYWECEAEKNGLSTVTYGETPELAWQWWRFHRLGCAPPRGAFKKDLTTQAQQ